MLTAWAISLRRLVRSRAIVSSTCAFTYRVRSRGRRLLRRWGVGLVLFKRPCIDWRGLARYAALTSCVPWVNLGLIFAVVHPVASSSVAAAWNAARGRPAEVLRFR